MLCGDYGTLETYHQTNIFKGIIHLFKTVFLLECFRIFEVTQDFDLDFKTESITRTNQVMLLQKYVTLTAGNGDQW